MAGLSQVYEKKTGRRLPSTVTEMSEGSEGDLSAEMGRMGLDSPTKSSAPEIVLPPMIIEPGPSTINVPTFDISPPSTNLPTFSIAPPTIVEPRTVTPPTIIEPGSKPATFTPLPSINIEEDDGSGIVFAGLPTIAVSSFDTSDQPSSVPTSTHTPQPTRIDPTSAIVCTGCSNPIIGRIVSAMGQRWHPQCFMCGECGELLEHVSSYEFNGRPYCHLDYHDVSY
jgi:paxillin